MPEYYNPAVTAAMEVSSNTICLMTTEVDERTLLAARAAPTFNSSAVSPVAKFAGLAPETQEENFAVL